MNPRSHLRPTARSSRARLGLLLLAMGFGAMTSIVPIAVRPAGAESDAETVDSAGRILRVQNTGANSWLVDGSLFGHEFLVVPVGGSTSIALSLPEGLRATNLTGYPTDPDSQAEAQPESQPESQLESQLAAPLSGIQIGIAGERRVAVRAGTDPVSLDLPAGMVDEAGTASYAVEAAPGSTAEPAAGNQECVAFQPVVLHDVAVSVAGTFAKPMTFAEFFPYVLDRLIIRLERSDAANPQVAQSVIDLVGLAARKWPHASVLVMDGADSSLELTPFDRTIVFRPWAAPGVSIDEGATDATLVLGGAVQDSPRLVSYVASPQFDASFRSRVNPEAVPSSIRPHAPYLTVAELRGGGVSATGFGTAGITLDVEQSMLGGQMESISASVTGVARTDTAGSVTVQLRANDRILATQRVGSDELFSLTGSLSSPSLSSKNEFEVRVLDTSLAEQSAQGAAIIADARSVPISRLMFDRCGIVRPPEITLELDPTSSFEGTRGIGVSAGFDRFPQAFAGGFDIRFGTGLDGSAFDDLVGAASMFQLLQQQTKYPLLARVSSGEPEVGKFARPTLFVTASGSPAISLAGLGISDNDAGTQADDSGPATAPGSAAPTASYQAEGAAAVKEGSAALSAVQYGAYDHLLLAADSTESIGRLLSQALSNPVGLRSLTGDLMVEHDGRVKNLRINATAFVQNDRPDVAYRTRVGFPSLLGFAVGTLVAIVVVISRRWTHR